MTYLLCFLIIEHEIAASERASKRQFIFGGYVYMKARKKDPNNERIVIEALKVLNEYFLHH